MFHGGFLFLEHSDTIGVFGIEEYLEAKSICGYFTLS
jgi:hypothetical protein